VSPSSATPTWPRVRAGLITLVIAIGLVAGMPLPSDEQLVRFPSWYAWLVPVLRRAQELALVPFRPIGDNLVLTQRWNLFSGAKAQRYWLRLEGRDAKSGKYVLLYRPHDPAHDLDGAVLEYRRVRGSWNPRGGAAQAGYEAFVSFEARRLLLEHPELDAVRASFETIEVLPRGRGFRPTGHVSFAVVRERLEVIR
jgi:hypothetical protein